MAPCTQTHPVTGDACTRESDHVQSPDPKEKQHHAVNGVRWPTLHELAPHEGYNDFVPRSL